MQRGSQYGTGRGRTDGSGQQAFTELNGGRRYQCCGFHFFLAKVGGQCFPGVFQAEESPDGFFQFAQRDQAAVFIHLQAGHGFNFLVR